MYNCMCFREDVNLCKLDKTQRTILKVREKNENSYTTTTTSTTTTTTTTRVREMTFASVRTDATTTTLLHLLANY